MNRPLLAPASGQGWDKMGLASSRLRREEVFPFPDRGRGDMLSDGAGAKTA